MSLTIGVMARAPVPGRCKTRLSPPLTPDEAAALYKTMLRDSFAAYARVGAARQVVMAAPEHDGAAILRELAPPTWDVIAQQGEDLGARLAHAFTTLGGTGDAVALLDSDSPTVPIRPVADALAALAGEERALSGPCDDGGYYLVALGVVGPRSVGIVDEIPWSTPRVMDATRARCAALGLPLDELPTWYDVDDAGSLLRLRDELQRDPTRAPRTAGWLQQHDAEVSACASL